MPSQEDIDNEEQLLAAHRRTLATYLRKITLQGGEAYAVPADLAGLQEARDNIRRIKESLRRWEVSVEDLPDDEPDGQPPSVQPVVSTSESETRRQPIARVIVFREGDDQEFTPDARESFVRALARLVNINSNQIRIVQVGPGRVKVTLEMPLEAVNLLVSLHLNNDTGLQRLGVWKVVRLQPPLVILGINVLIAAALAYPVSAGILSWISIPCTSREVITLSSGVIPLIGLQVIWRVLWHYFPMLIRALAGEIGFWGIHISLHPLIQAVDEIHPWFLHLYMSWAIALALVIFSLLPVALFRAPGPPPLIRGFEVEYPGGPKKSVEDNATIEVVAGQSIVVKTLFLDDEANVRCTWSAIDGFVVPAKGCSGVYTPPFQGELDGLTVNIESACMSYHSFSGLHVNIVRALPKS